MKSNKYFLVPLLLMMSLLKEGFVQPKTAVPEWVQRYTHALDADDYALKVVHDAAGNVVVAGHTGTGITSDDMLIIKYSGAGVALWTNRYNAPGNSIDQATAAAADSRGNIFLTGRSYNDVNADYATITYSSEGALLWVNRYDGFGNSFDQPSAIAVDVNGNVFVTGSSQASGSSSDYAAIAYSTNGVALWTNRYNGVGNATDEATAIAVGSNGKVFVTGRSHNGTNDDYVTIAYSNGVAFWTNRYTRPFSTSDQAVAIAVDGSDRVYVTGSSTGSGTMLDYTTVGYSSAGVALWTNRYDGISNSADGATAIAVDSSGNVYVTGSSMLDYATVAFSSAGVALWTNRYGGDPNDWDEAHAIAVDASGNVYVTGASTGGDSPPDFVTVAYSRAGAPLWTNRYNGSANGSDAPGGKKCIAVGPDGSVYVTGSSDGDFSVGTIYEYATVKYAVSPWIINQPASRTNVPGAPVTFSVFARGSMPLTYQWLKNSTPIPNATNSVLAYDSVSSNDAASYAVVISNFAGSITSSVAILTVTAPLPVIVSLQAGVPGPGTNTLTFISAPGYAYITEYATNLTGSPWFCLSTNMATGNGQWTVLDPGATNAERYYRVVTP